MSLSFQQGLIRDYISEANKDGKSPKISEIASACGVSCDEVRSALVEIRKSRETSVDFFKRMFGM